MNNEMKMELPKGTFKPLAKLLGPLSLWMAAGWAAYPYLIVKVSDAMGEAIDAGEVELFSYIMVPTFVVLGIVFIIYGFSGKEVPDAQIVALNPDKWPCPRCLKPQAADSKKCENCGMFIEK